MREIKFRAWRDGYFIYSDRSVNVGGFSESLTLNEDGFASRHNNSDWDWGPYKDVMQYTGLKDKNGDVGQEVYEGDIIDEYGKIKGNIYEMDATDSDLIITNLTGRDWFDTYKKAMDRGLTHSE